MKDNNLTCCVCFSSFISYCFLLFIGAIISIVTLNTKHVDVLVLIHLSEAFVTSVTAFVHKVMQSPHSDYVTRCYFNICLQQGSRDDRVSRGVLVFCMYSTLYSVQYGEILLS